MTLCKRSTSHETPLRERGPNSSHRPLSRLRQHHFILFLQVLNRLRGCTLPGGAACVCSLSRWEHTTKRRWRGKPARATVFGRPSHSTLTVCHSLRSVHIKQQVCPSLVPVAKPVRVVAAALAIVLPPHFAT